jgi:hypothetical protein
MLRGVSDACEGSKILTFLLRPRVVCRARSYISEARERLILYEVPYSNLRAPPRRCGRTSRRLSTMAVTPPNFATNRARKRSKVLRLVTLNFLENFSPVPLELFLLWLLSHTKNAQQRRIRAWLIV